MAFRVLLFRFVMFISSPVIVILILTLIAGLSDFPPDTPDDAASSYLYLCIAPIVGLRFWLWVYLGCSFHSFWSLDDFSLTTYVEYLALIRATPQMKLARPFNYERVALLHTILATDGEFTEEECLRMEAMVRNWDLDGLHTMFMVSQAQGIRVEHVDILVVVYYHPSECVNYSLLMAIHGPTREHGYRARTIASADHRGAYVPRENAKFKRFSQYYYHRGVSDVYSIRHLLK